MPGSTLDPDNIPDSDRQLGKGHDTGALGPGDISDSGSDVQGGYRAVEDDMLPLDRGTNEDQDSHNVFGSPVDSDSTGTGESSTAGRNADVEAAADIDFDRIDYINPEDDPDYEGPDLDVPPASRKDGARQPRRP